MNHVSAAAAGGLITSNADNALMRHDANYTSPIGNMLNGTEAANFYLTKPFVDHLKGAGDPRLSAIAIRYVGATSGNAQQPAVGTTVAANQMGMPMGYDNGKVPRMDQHRHGCTVFRRWHSRAYGPDGLL